MSMNNFAMAEAGRAPEAGTTFLRHALKIWAREQGVAEDSLSGVIGEVLDFALATIDDGRQPSGLSS